MECEFLYFYVGLCSVNFLVRILVELDILLLACSFHVVPLMLIPRARIVELSTKVATVTFSSSGRSHLDIYIYNGQTRM